MQAEEGAMSVCVCVRVCGTAGRGDECWPPIRLPSFFSSVHRRGDGPTDRQVYSIAATASSSSSPPPSWFECSSSANSASIFSLAESIPIMFGGEKLLKQEVKGEAEREARDCDTRLFAVWRVEKEESKGGRR